MSRLEDDQAQIQALLLYRLTQRLIMGKPWELNERRDARLLVNWLIGYCRKVSIQNRIESNRIEPAPRQP